MSAPTPVGGTEAHNMFFNNCQTDIEYAIIGCCLAGWDATGFGPSEPYYMTEEEVRAFIEEEWAELSEALRDYQEGYHGGI